MPNHLIDETSPYLLQHADNPVHWYPWGEEALQQAQVTDRPIFLSIGYSACHWCHVMAHESFEDQGTAAILNEHFVSIKVDREERPDLDQIYMAAVQVMTGSGGWPMSVFLTPEGTPFYGGTYFPPTPRYGMPSFTQVLHAIVDAWQNRRDELVASGQKLVAAIRQQGQADATSASKGRDLNESTLQSAFRALQQSFDRANGGWGQAPKFPQPMALEFLLRYHHSTGNPNALEMVTQTLEAMARGGMYDQLGGGFHRYSVDDHWLVPHFERMSYDNAQLARVYLHAWQVTGNEVFRTITEEILDYVVREMTDPTGGFYSTQDADSEGEEGKFFVWTPDEIWEVLGNDADDFMAAYGVTRHGNFEGKNILEFVGDLDQRPALAGARHKLFEARKQRVHPGRDEKVLTSWNGLMLAAFAEAARAFSPSPETGRGDQGVRAETSPSPQPSPAGRGSSEVRAETYRLVAERNAEFLLRELRQENGRLLRSWKDGEAKLNGYLEDYACLIEGLLELYQTTFEPRWFVAAQELAETMLERFADSEGVLYDTSDDHETLITRPRDLQDNATPSGNAMAVTTLLKLAGFTNDLRYVDLAHHTLAEMQPMLAQYPLGFGQWLQALAYAFSKPLEIAIVGDPEAADTQALLSVVRDEYRPFQVVALGSPDSGNAADRVTGIAAVPLLQDRGLVDGRAAAYVCRDFACQAPVMRPEALRHLLDRK
jgi:uncharacterized protein YyaL (SSP411 family)